MKASPDPFRDPLYGTIRPDSTCYGIIDTREFQRLRRVRQLSLAYLQYPSAVHTRFEHSLGVQHLAVRIVDTLANKGELSRYGHGEIRAYRKLVAAAACCHDLGQSLTGHLLEEFGADAADHEADGAALIVDGEVGRVLDANLGPGAKEEVTRIMTHTSTHPLADIVASDLDADKMDYLRRDAYHCGTPISFDQEFLIDCMCLVEDQDRTRLGIEARGLPAFEGLLLAKAKMYRAVYFHPIVRCAMAMLRSLILEVTRAGWIDSRRILELSDDELFAFIRIDEAKGVDPAVVSYARDMTDRILHRRLYHRSLQIPLSERVPLSANQILAVQEVLEEYFGVPHGDVILDIPSKPHMLGTNVPVRLPNGELIQAYEADTDMGFAIPRSMQDHYDATGSIALLTKEPQSLNARTLLGLMEEVAAEVPAS